MSNGVDASTGELVEVEAVEPSAMMIADRAALDVQVSTAKQYPRSVQAFRSDLQSWSCEVKEIAAECTYAKPVGGRDILGPSVRFAELVQQAYGNLIVDCQQLPIEHKRVMVVATCRDLEKNTAAKIQVSRSIIGRNGKRFPDHLIETTLAAISSIAIRNAIFRIVPRALWLSVHEKTKEVALGGQTHAEWIESAVAHLATMEIPIESVDAWVGRRHEDWTVDDITSVRLRVKSITDGVVSKEAAFPSDAEVETAERSAGPAAQAATVALSKAQHSVTISSPSGEETIPIEPNSLQFTEGEPPETTHDKDEPPDDWDFDKKD